jgi:hypothetical protein
MGSIVWNPGHTWKMIVQGSKVFSGTRNTHVVLTKSFHATFTSQIQLIVAQDLRAWSTIILGSRLKKEGYGWVLAVALTLCNRSSESEANKTKLKPSNQSCVVESFWVTQMKHGSLTQIHRTCTACPKPACWPTNSSRNTWQPMAMRPPSTHPDSGSMWPSPSCFPFLSTTLESSTPVVPMLTTYFTLSLPCLPHLGGLDRQLILWGNPCMGLCLPHSWSLSVPGYLQTALQECQHSAPRWAQHAPSHWSCPIYGAKIQLMTPPDASPPPPLTKDQGSNNTT